MVRPLAADAKDPDGIQAPGNTCTFRGLLLRPAVGLLVSSRALGSSTWVQFLLKPLDLINHAVTGSIVHVL